jgi:hypothetical protein
LALFAMVIGIVPGAVSLMGLAISMSAVLVSLFSIKKSRKKYFGVTIAIALASTFLVNAALRIWDPLPMPLDFKIGLYGIVLLVLGGCSLIAYRLGSAQ